MADVKATEVILLELVKNFIQLTQEAMDSDPVILTIPKPELLDTLNSLVSNVFIVKYPNILTKLLVPIFINIFFSGQAGFLSE